MWEKRGYVSIFFWCGIRKTSLIPYLSKEGNGFSLHKERVEVLKQGSTILFSFLADFTLKRWKGWFCSLHSKRGKFFISWRIWTTFFFKKKENYCLVFPGRKKNHFTSSQLLIQEKKRMVFLLLSHIKDSSSFHFRNGRDVFLFSWNTLPTLWGKIPIRGPHWTRIKNLNKFRNKARLKPVFQNFIRFSNCIHLKESNLNFEAQIGIRLISFDFQNKQNENP